LKQPTKVQAWHESPTAISVSHLDKLNEGISKEHLMHFFKKMTMKLLYFTLRMMSSGLPSMKILNLQVLLLVMCADFKFLVNEVIQNWLATTMTWLTPVSAILNITPNQTKTHQQMKITFLEIM
jgi:hypothetical protein